MQKQFLTSSVYSFESLRNGSFLYVDKTEYIWRLVESANAMYFLSRPRRFGKSLTISTLKALFQGRKELFRGLAIYDRPYDWKPHPVIHLDMGSRKSSSVEQLENALLDALKNCADSLGVVPRGDDAQTQLGNLILDVSKTAPAVILVDEYDKPILDNIGQPEEQAILRHLKGFYSSIKTGADRIRFALVTGVTKFCHVSLFSDLNNLQDISRDSHYAAMLGYTQEEFERSFALWIAEAESRQELSHEKFLEKIKNWYDGYRFHEKAESVYNPVSLASFFLSGGEFKNFWFATGTPSFLIQLVKKTNFDFEKVLTKPVSEIAFSAYEADRLEALPLLLQTGYLTIKNAFEDFGMTFYNLQFPNLEVRSAFDNYLLNAYTSIDKDSLAGYAVEMAAHVRSGDVEKFMEELQTFFAAIPYDIQIQNERYYQTIFYTLFLLLGVYIEAEARTNRGRIDAVAACGDWIYIFEFKLDQDADAALAQIRNMEYYQKYHKLGKRLVLIGANFDSQKRQIADWLHKEL